MMIQRPVIFALALIASFKVSAAPPDWYFEHMQDLSPDAGTWIADNSEYVSDDEPYEAYGIEWHWTLGKQGVTGRLFGIIDEKEVATFWEFRLYWHPGDERAYLQQFSGNGRFGTGILYMVGDDTYRVEQDFFTPDGTVTRSGHETVVSDRVHDGYSYQILPDGSWQMNRHYVWHLVDE